MHSQGRYDQTLGYNTLLTRYSSSRLSLVLSGRMYICMYVLYICTNNTRCIWFVPSFSLSHGYCSNREVLANKKYLVSFFGGMECINIMQQ